MFSSFLYCGLWTHRVSCGFSSGFLFHFLSFSFFSLLLFYFDFTCSFLVHIILISRECKWLFNFEHDSRSGLAYLFVTFTPHVITLLCICNILLFGFWSSELHKISCACIHYKYQHMITLTLFPRNPRKDWSSHAIYFQFQTCNTYYCITTLTLHSVQPNVIKFLWQNTICFHSRCVRP